MAEKKNCLVTGATGVVGPALVKHLLEKGYQVRILHRAGSNNETLPDGINRVVGDIKDRESVQKAVKDIDLVFHMAALLHINDPDPDLENKYHRINVLGTKTILEASADENVQRFVFFSTINVYEPSPDGGIRTESSYLKPDSFYADSKVKAEELVLSAKRKLDHKPFGMVLRSAAVYGPHMKGNYTRIIKGVSRGWFYPIGKCENRRTLIADIDLARAAVLCAEHPDAVSEIYNVTDGQTYTFKEILDAIWKGLDKKPPKIFIPLFPVYSGVFLLQMMFKLLRKKPPLSLITVKKMLEDRSVAGNKIQDEIGFSPSISLEKGWERAIDGIIGTKLVKNG